ncbi:aldehyde dehydrogenase family protein [Actinophytocola oryzae]|uniref:Glutamate-5-semialdehyde dehydrogenase n=1 Tax=Actinophytocola oryzae TaxID=502181 RepID=A0A4R7VSR7_9PSEU|nr:aldehyde dehydrogenase family protein [Actinophytocola oryzae]TDV52257.1 glutamate-5-semialdehyde dehydrogenase [Actinophytocola oryzae]
MTVVSESVSSAVSSCAQAAYRAAPALAAAPDETIDGALSAMAGHLRASAEDLLAANEADVQAAVADGMSAGLLDRLRLSPERLDTMASALELLASTPHPQKSTFVRDLPDGLKLYERRRPVGVIGANYEARPNVTVDVASQLVKSRNAGVLRTGGAALGSATALVRSVIAPALEDVSLDPAAIQLVPTPDRAAASALVAQPAHIPLVILRGSGDTTRTLGQEAARHGVRTLAHADGGGVLYVDVDADQDVALDLVKNSVDRLGVCNRLNLLLIHSNVYEAVLPRVEKLLAGLDIAVSLPPHSHPIGYEWALDSDREATVTVLPVSSAREAAEVADRETSGLAACIATTSRETAELFMDAYTGTGVFWNATTRLLDGFKLLAVPETGINIDKVPGPRGPVTYPDLCLRQYAVLPA